MNCLILDDVKADRSVINRYCQRCGFFENVQAFEKSTRAVSFLENTEVDVLFLDINMPKLSGFELLNSLNRTPEVIFMTSDKTYASKAFDFDAVDFLLKPVNYRRFLSAVEKVAEQNAAKRGRLQNDEEESQVFLKVGSTYIKLILDEILYVQAYGDYVKFITVNNEFTIHSTLKNILNSLPSSKFIRVHRSYVVNKRHISSFENSEMQISDSTIPVSKSYRTDLKESLRML